MGVRRHEDRRQEDRRQATGDKKTGDRRQEDKETRRQALQGQARAAQSSALAAVLLSRAAEYHQGGGGNGDGMKKGGKAQWRRKASGVEAQGKCAAPGTVLPQSRPSRVNGRLLMPLHCRLCITPLHACTHLELVALLDVHPGGRELVADVGKS